jgi:hypothetical protein
MALAEMGLQGLVATITKPALGVDFHFQKKDHVIG